MDRSRLGAPRSFVDLAAHPVRWQLIGVLARGDRRVDELVEVVGQPQPLVSYHLGRLRDVGLVSSRRSSKDARASYYHLDLDRCGESLTRAGATIHPGLALVAPVAPAPSRRPPGPATRVMFACTGNSARSQIAEALLRRVGGRSLTVVSAGSHPKPIHPLAVKVLADEGIDIGDWRSKPLSDFDGQHFDVVVTLCDKVREVCPDFPGGERIHWSIEDPTSGGRVDLARFRRLTADIATRIRWLTWIIRTNQPTPTGGRDHAHRSGQRPLHRR